MSQGVGVIGGQQGPKALLDAVRTAVSDGSLDTLARLSKEFLAVHDNVLKCVDESGNTIVHLSLGKTTNTLQFVIDNLRADVNAANYQGRTPLHECVTRNYVECCELLLESGADDSVQSSTLSTPFHTAAACGSVECMEILLKHSSDATAKINELDKNKSSALHKCAFDGDVRVSRWLVDHGASVDTADHQNVTPLLVAVKMGQKSVVEYLLSKGANPNHRDSQGNTCAHYCAMRCDTATLEKLLESGANVKVQNSEYNSPLHLAAIHQRPDSKEWEELLVILLKNGCDPELENASRKKASDYVSRGLKKLFTKEEVALKEKKERESLLQMEKNRAESEKTRLEWGKKVKSDIERFNRLEQAEKERLHLEGKDVLQADEEARTNLDKLLTKVAAKQRQIESLEERANKEEAKK